MQGRLGIQQNSESISCLGECLLESVFQSFSLVKALMSACEEGGRKCLKSNLNSLTSPVALCPRQGFNLSCDVLPRGLGYSCHPVLVISGNTKLDMHPGTDIMFSQGYVKHILHFSCEIFGLELFKSPAITGKNRTEKPVNIISATSHAKSLSWCNLYSVQIAGTSVIKNKYSGAFYLGKMASSVDVHIEISKIVCNIFHFGKTHPSSHQTWTGHLLSKK